LTLQLHDCLLWFEVFAELAELFAEQPALFANWLDYLQSWTHVGTAYD
jgi:hypothetical protein